MKTSIKIILAIVILLVLIGIGYAVYQHFKKVETQKQDAKLTAAVKSDFSVKPQATFTDVTGAKHNQYDAKKNTFTADVIAGRKDSSLGGPDTAAAILKIQREQIENWKQAAISYQARALKAESMKDSLGHLVRYYKNKYVEIAYHEPNGADTNGTFDYKGHFNFTSTDYYKSKFLWMRYNPVTDISIDDPNATINGYRSFSVIPAAQTFNLKARVKAYYNFATGRVTPSTGVEINAGRFDIDGMYYYNTRLQKLSPAVSLSYNLFQLHK